jgi:hypothetical protein
LHEYKFYDFRSYGSKVMGVLNFLEKSRQGRHVLERIDHMWKKMGAGRRK